MQYEEVLAKLRSLANPEAVEKMKRFGITAKNTYGVSIPDLRTLAKKIGEGVALKNKTISR